VICQNYNSIFDEVICQNYNSIFDEVIFDEVIFDEVIFDEVIRQNYNLIFDKVINPHQEAPTCFELRLGMIKCTAIRLGQCFPKSGPRTIFGPQDFLFWSARKIKLTFSYQKIEKMCFEI
jgi:hypothetical protein